MSKRMKAMLLSQEEALRERDTQVLKLQETVDSQQAALASRAAEVEHLKLLIARLRRMQFGRKSEKLDHQIEQLELRLEELEADEGAAPIEIPKTPRKAVEQTPRKSLPEHPPREIRMHLPESAGKCTQCGGKMKSLGETSPNSLSMCRQASVLSVMYVRSLRACVAITSPRRLHRVVPSNAVSPARGYWHTYWSRSLQTTCRFTGSRSCMHAKASSWIWQAPLNSA